MPKEENITWKDHCSNTASYHQDSQQVLCRQKSKLYQSPKTVNKEQYKFITEEIYV